LTLLATLALVVVSGCKDATQPEPRGFWQDVSAYGDHTCGLSRTGAVYCWGSGYDIVPKVPVPSLTASELYRNQCARNAQNEFYCWGGPAGPTPFRILAGERVLSVSRGSGNICALVGEGVAMCSGDNTYAQLGNGTSGAPRAAFAPVVGSYRFTSLAAMGWAPCGIVAGGAAVCWGHNYFAQLGRRTTETCLVGGTFADPCSTSPGPVSGNISFRTLDVGGGHACGIATDGRVYCWGFDMGGVLGTATAPDRCTANNSPCSYTPVLATNRTDFESIHASSGFNCGLTAAGDAHCWGANYEGQLGDGVSSPFGTGGSRREALPVSGGRRFKKLALGDGHACGLTGEGKMFCWGSNERGQLGIATFLNYNTPVEVFDPKAR
jgi:alpha-tubulin suppressor-like RCC1 family protein